MLKYSIKLILTFLLFLCLADMPCGYYEFLWLIALVGFAYLAYEEYQKDNKGLAFVYLALVILFQPLLKIYLGRTLWNIIDVIVDIFLIATIHIHLANLRFQL